MKKIYSAPEVLVELINVENCLMAGSPALSDSDANKDLENLSREIFDDRLFDED